MTSVAIEARSVSFSYANPVVEDFSLSLSPAMVTGIIGPNGCGKTTTLRILDGILRPQAGEVLLHDRPVSALSRKEIARQIAVVPQNGGLYPFQTVFSFTMLGRSPHLSLLGFETAKDIETVVEALELTHLSSHQAKRVSEISGGEKQRLLLARALAQKSEVLLLDELTANLDVNYQVELMGLVRRLTLERRLATLVVSHEINLLASFCDHIVLMSRGRIQRQGPAREVLTRDSLNRLFGLDFRVSARPSGKVDVIPVMDPTSEQ